MSVLRSQSGRTRASNSKRAFTLIEVMVSVVLLGIGIVVALGSLSAMTRGEIKIRRVDTLNRLATQKLDEILAVGQLNTAANSGTFEDIGFPDVEWSIETAPADLENLETVTVIVTDSSSPNDSDGIRMSSLIFTSPNIEPGATN